MNAISFFQMLRLLAPTLVLLHALIPGNLRAFMPYCEFFGEGDYFLEVYFKANPLGPLRPPQKDSLGFDGYLVSKGTEEKIYGQVIRQPGRAPQYIFQSSRGKFVGQLTKQAGRCEPKLQFKFEHSLQKAQATAGELQGAFCLGS